MPRASTSVADWYSLLEPASPFPERVKRVDDPRLGEAVEFWRGQADSVRPGRPVLIGFPQDEGVRRNFGRPGAAAAPPAIRKWLYRLTPFDAQDNVDLTRTRPLDVGDVRTDGGLETTQETLGKVIGAVLKSGAVPVVLGGGHETAYGHYLGYVAAGREVAIVNFDAHLDLRPPVDGRGHSGSMFRQAFEHPDRPLQPGRYACLGAQPQATSREHWEYARKRDCPVHWSDGARDHLADLFDQEVQRLAAHGCPIYVTLDADCVHGADVPGVSAPAAIGLTGQEVVACARRIGATPAVASFDLVEISPPFDRDSQSVRWAAVVIWNFLVGLALRGRHR